MLVQMHGAARDYIDMDALIHLGGVTLSSALAAARGLYGKSFSPEITLKALSHLDGSDSRELPPDLRLRLADAVKGIDLDQLPRLARTASLPD